MLQLWWEPIPNARSAGNLNDHPERWLFACCVWFQDNLTTWQKKPGRGSSRKLMAIGWKVWENVGAIRCVCAVRHSAKSDLGLQMFGYFASLFYHSDSHPSMLASSSLSCKSIQIDPKWWQLEITNPSLRPSHGHQLIMRWTLAYAHWIVVGNAVWAVLSSSSVWRLTCDIHHHFWVVCKALIVGSKSTQLHLLWLAGYLLLHLNP